MSTAYYPQGMIDARLGLNAIAYVSWKGQTLEQVTSVLKQNTKTLNPNPDLSIYQLRKPMPLEIYRREIATIQNPSCSRNSSTVAAFEQPGGSIVNSNIKTNTGLDNILNLKLTTITSERPGECAIPSNCFLSPETNAKRRVRSSGMNTKQFKPNYNNDKAYFTSTKEYLVSRNRTIQQNMYNYFKQSNSGVQPNTGNAKSNVYGAGNVYTPGGLSHCYQPLVDASNNNNVFSYVWLDNVRYYVTIPDGRYDIEALNNYFKKVMIVNEHYFINNTTTAKVFLLTIDYDNFNNLVILEANPASQSLPFPSDSYTPACGFTGPNWYTNLPLGNPTNILDGSYNFTSIGIPLENNFGDLVGFPGGDYYNGGNKSQTRPQIAPNFVPLYFKPNNIIFGQQGSVDSSTYTDRRRYNAVTRNGYLTQSAFGTATANAMAYGVSEQPYTQKTKVGFRDTLAPTFKLDGSLCCRKFIYRRL